MFKQLILIGLLFVGSSLNAWVCAVELTGVGEYVAPSDIAQEDAFRFARNRALADASEQASTLVESNVTLVKSGQQQWARQEVRQLSASLLHVKDMQKTKEKTSDGIRYHVVVTADFDDAQQHTLQAYLADNQDLRKQLQDLAAEQNALQNSINYTQKVKQVADQVQNDIDRRERPQLLIGRYEQKLLDTKSWLSAQQRQHLDIALQTVEMQQAIERNKKAQEQERQRIAANMAAARKTASEQDAKQVANMRYISAQRIQRFVQQHMPLRTEDMDVKPINEEQVSVRYRLVWQMVTEDIERLCQLFYDGGLAEQCKVSEDNTSVTIKVKQALLTGLFLPFSEHKSVWKNPSLTLFTQHNTAPSPETFALDKSGVVVIKVAGSLPMILTTQTTKARELMAGGQDLIGGKWQ